MSFISRSSVRASLFLTGWLLALVLMLPGCAGPQLPKPLVVPDSQDARGKQSANPAPAPNPPTVQSQVGVAGQTEATSTAEPVKDTLESLPEVQTAAPDSPTALPVVKLFVPEQWQEEAAAAISSLVNNANWQIVDDSSEAQIGMFEGEGTIEAGARPIALSVPFTHHLVELTLEEALQVIDMGSDDIAAVDWWDVPRGSRALPVDSLLPYQEAYQPVQRWSLSADAGYERYAYELGLALTRQLDDERLVHIAAVGDIMLDRTLGNYIATGDLEFPFEKVAAALVGADITVGNLETAVGESGQPEQKSYNFLSPSGAAQSLALAGFDLVSLANNHAMDFGPETLLQGMALLAEQGVLTAGAGADSDQAREPVIIEKNGISVAFLSYVDVPVEVTGFDTRSWEAGVNSPGLAWADPEIIAHDVVEARTLAGVVVILLHSGYEFLEAPSPAQIAAAEAAIDAGAALVLSHHSHLLQGIDFYNDGVILYGLGNFAFNMDGSTDSAIFNIWLDETGVRGLDILPAIIGLGGQPAIASPADSWRIRQDISRLTSALNPP